MYYGYNISEETARLAREAERDCYEVFQKIEENSLICSAKILTAFQEARVSSSDFLEVTGYGYTDFGRDSLRKFTPAYLTLRTRLFARSLCREHMHSR